jgi:hypothetical protein
VAPAAVARAAGPSTWPPAVASLWCIWPQELCGPTTPVGSSGWPSTANAVRTTGPPWRWAATSARPSSSCWTPLHSPCRCCWWTPWAPGWPIILISRSRPGSRSASACSKPWPSCRYPWCWCARRWVGASCRPQRLEGCSGIDSVPCSAWLVVQGRALDLHALGHAVPLS